MGRGEVLNPTSDGRLRTISVTERILAKVEKLTDSGCWIFMGALRRGYGAISVGSDRDGSARLASAHVVLYEATVGPVPPPLELDHKCRVRCCVNPAHLEPVTAQVNLLRGETRAAANAAKVACPKHGDPYVDQPTARQAKRRICRKGMAEAQARHRLRGTRS